MNFQWSILWSVTYGDGVPVGQYSMLICGGGPRLPPQKGINVGSDTVFKCLLRMIYLVISV